MKTFTFQGLNGKQYSVDYEEKLMNYPNAWADFWQNIDDAMRRDGTGLLQCAPPYQPSE